MNIPIKRAAIAQLCSTSNKLENLRSVAKCAGLAKRHGASMLFIPECFGFIGSTAQETLDNAEPIGSTLRGDNDEIGGLVSGHSGIPLETKQTWLSNLTDLIDCFSSNDLRSEQPRGVSGVNSMKEEVKIVSNKDVSIVHGLRTIAAHSGLWVSGGGMHEAGAPPLITLSEIESKEAESRSRVYNTHIIIDDRGDLITKYRKIHLFDVSIPSQNIDLRESATTAPGSKLVVCKDTPLGTLGLSTCYDVRFSEMYQRLVEDGGADVLLVPSAFTVPTGRAHWHALLRARAIENQCYVIAAAQFGEHNEKRRSYGHSIAIDPWGEIIADAGGYDGPGTGSAINTGTTEGTTTGTAKDEGAEPSIILCDIDDKKIKSIRERMPIRKHRHDCMFSW